MCGLLDSIFRTYRLAFDMVTQQTHWGGDDGDQKGKGEDEGKSGGVETTPFLNESDPGSGPGNNLMTV